MAIHSSILALRRIPWAEEPGGLQTMESYFDYLFPCAFITFFFQQFFATIFNNFFSFNCVILQKSEHTNEHPSHPCSVLREDKPA